MPYNLPIRIEFDPAKDAENRRKHGVSLAFGAEVLADPERLDTPDARFDYTESRFVSYGMIKGRVWACVFVMRGNVHRVISVRRANEREQRRYREDSR
jgi:uncharacterized DUF497 family protein